MVMNSDVVTDPILVTRQVLEDTQPYNNSAGDASSAIRQHYPLDTQPQLTSTVPNYSHPPLAQVSVPCQIRQWLFVNQGARVPGSRQLEARSPDDKIRRTAIKEKGGTCAPCGHSKKQCDASDHCQSCIHRGIQPEISWLQSLFESLDTSNISLGVLMTSQDDVSSGWFHGLTSGIGSDQLVHKVSLGITSSSLMGKSSSFCFEIPELFDTFDDKACSPRPESMMEAFLNHSNNPLLGQTSGALSSHDISDVSWLVCHTFALLDSFADAQIHAALSTSIATARVALAAVYTTLCRFLIAKTNELCSLVVRSLGQGTQTCWRPRPVLRALVQYYHVVHGLAHMKHCSEVAELLSPLTVRAQEILRNDGFDGLVKRFPREVQKGTVEKTISSNSSKLPVIEPLVIALRVNPTDSSINPPVPTVANRYANPHQPVPVKVRDLLRKTTVDPREVYLQKLTDDVNSPQGTHPDHAESSDRLPSPAGGTELHEMFFHYETTSVSPSLDPEIGTRLSSQPTMPLESIESESTVNGCSFWSDFDNLAPASDMNSQFADIVQSGDAGGCLLNIFSATGTDGHFDNIPWMRETDTSFASMFQSSETDDHFTDVPPASDIDDHCVKTSSVGEKDDNSVNLSPARETDCDDWQTVPSKKCMKRRRRSYDSESSNRSTCGGDGKRPRIDGEKELSKAANPYQVLADQSGKI